MLVFIERGKLCFSFTFSFTYTLNFFKTHNNKHYISLMKIVLDKKSELTNKLYNELSTKIEDLEISVKQDLKRTKVDTDKINSSLKSCHEKIEELQNTVSKETLVLKNEVNQLSSTTGEWKEVIKGDLERQIKVKVK